MSRAIIASTTAGLVFLLAACGGSPPAPVAPMPTTEGFPSSPPAPLPVEDVEFPAFAERTLRNGARVIVVENREQPVVSISLVLPGGTAADPEGMAGLASITAAQLDKGTETMSARELAEATDFLGANLFASASSEWSTVGLTTITDFLDEGLELMSDVVLHPTFPEEELQTEKQRRISALRLARSQTGTLAQQTFMKELYGEHPYGDFETVGTIEAIDAEDLKRFHEAHYRPSDALIVVAGDVDPGEVTRRLDVAFAGWEGQAPAIAAAPAPPAPPEGREMVFVHKPGSVQAVIRLGHLFPSATDADWVTLDVANQILGAGGFTAWMMSVLREEKGYTYGARSQMAERQGPGYFVMTGEFRNEVADSSLMIMLELAERLRAGEIPAEDLEAAKLYLTGRFPRMIETPQQVAGQVSSNRLLGRPDSYLEEYRGRVAAVEIPGVARASSRYIHPDNSTIVVVGDAAEVLEKVRPFADRLRVLDTEGNPVDVQAIAAAAAASEGLQFDVSALAPVELSYGIFYQGNEVASASTQWSREGSNMVVVNKQALPQMTVTSTTTFEAETFRPVSLVTDVGPMGSFEILVEDGRARGRGIDPQRGPVDVDAPMAEGVALDGMLDVAVAVTDPADVPEFVLKVLTGTGSVESQGVRVVGEETVEVPAGTFDTWKLEIGGQQPMTAWVTKTSPHLVVKRTVEGQPVEIVLKEMK